MLGNEPVELGSGPRHNPEAQVDGAPIFSSDVVEGQDSVLGVREV